MPQQNLAKSSKLQRGPFAYLNIFTLRFSGLTFDEIAEQTGYHPGYLRALFGRGGKLYDLWNEFYENAKAGSVGEAYTIMYSKLPKIAKTMTETASLPYQPSGVVAGKVVMEYTLGKALDKQPLEGESVLTSVSLVERVTLRRKQNEARAGRPDSTGVAE